jgi:hypothetical protein
MPTYSNGVTASAAAASGATYWSLNTGATRQARIRKLIVTTNATTTSNVGLIKASNTPVASTTVTPQAHNASDAAATVVIGTAWSTAPTVGTNYFETFTLGPAIGAGVTDKWSLDEVIWVAVSTWYILWNWGGSAGSALAVTEEHDE